MVHSYVSSQVDNSTTVYGGLGSQAVATPGNGGTGIWSIVSGPNNPTINATNPDLTVSGMSTGVYVFRWTISSDNPFCPPSVPSVDFTLTVNEPADAGADIDLCDATSVILQGNETLSNNGTWTFLSSTGSDSPNPVSIGNGLATVDIIPGNTYQFTYTTPGVACGDTDTVTVTNSAPPETPNAGTDQEVCLGDTNIATMNATALTSPSEGEWSVISEPAPGAANILAVNNPTTNIELSTTVEGLYIFQFKSTNPGSNCTNGISDFVRVNSYLEPSDAVITPIPDNSCQFSTVLEAATPINGLGTWELIDSNSLDGSGNPYNIAAYDPPASYTPGDISIDSPNNPTTALSIVNEYTLALGDYTFRWKVANGSCATKEDIITITYNGVPPTEPDAGPNQFLCASSSVIMNGNNLTVGTGEWSQVGTTPSIVTFDNKFNEDTGVTGLTSAGVYTFMWTSSNGGCSFSDTMEVTITDDVAAANAGPDQNLSQFDAVVLAANDPLPGEGVWTFVSGPNTPNILDINDPATNVAGTVPGTYEFTWTVDNNPCARTTDNVVITILPSVDLDLEKTLVTPLPISVGDVLDFQIEVTNNNANFDGTGVSVLDELPIGYSIVTGSVSNGGIYNAGGRSINWDGLTISKGSSVILTYKVTVEASGPYINTAQITSLDQSDPDSTPNNNVLSEDDQSSVTTTPGPVVDIALVKTVNNAAPNVGSNVIFTITVNNNGPSNATGIAVSDVLPSGYTYVSSNSATGGASIDDTTPASGTGIVWTVGNLANGASESLDITATVNASGSYNNTASISATNETDSDTSNNQDSEATVPVSVADLNLTKTVSAPANGSSYLVGEKVKFTITVNNAGPSIATGVNVVEYLPTGYSYDADNGSGAYTPATGSWVIGTIAAGGSSVLEIDAIINDSGNYNNVAEVVHSDQQDPDSTPGNNTITEDDQAQVDITPTKVANLSLVKTVDESTPVVGDNIKFTLALTNVGPSDATSVVVNDQLPVGYTFVSYTATSGAYDSATGNWTLSGSVLNGKTEYLDIVAMVNAATGAANEYKNDAEVTATDQFDPNSTENNGVVTEDDYSTTSTTPTPLIDLSLTKSVDNVQAVAGTDVVFTVIVSNDGPSNATGVVVTDQLPSGYTLVSHTGGASYVPATGVWTIGNLANGTTATLNVTATVLATGNYTNVAEITSATETDVDSAPNNDDLTEDDQDEVTVSRNPLVNLSLTKGVDVPSPNVGSNVKFTITVTNAGPSNATGVVVSDELPSGYSFVGATPSVGSYDSVSGSWTIGNLGITNATLEIEATVLPTGDYDNVAEITGTTEVDENSTPGNNDILEDDQEKVVVTPVERADLSVSKVVDISSPNVGDNVTFTIDVSNAGPSDATNVVITDQLPTGYQFVSASPTAGMYNSTTGLWTVSRPIIAGTTETIQIVATVLESGVYKNDAEVTASDQADPDSTVNDGTGDDFSTVTPSPSPLVDLALMKRIDNATPNVGSNVVFTIEIANNGPSDATNVISNDVLPSGYSWVSDDSAGAYVPGTGVWTIGSLANGTTTSLNITATVLATGVYTNTANVTSTEADSNSANNTNSISSTPRDVADISLLKTVVNATPNVGENAVFNLTVNNAGPSVATGIIVTDQLPSGYSYVSSVPSGTTTYNSVSGAWTVGALANGASATLSITAKVLGTGDYDNVAQVTGADQFDPNSTPGNNNPAENDYSEVPVTPINSSDLVTVKTVNNNTPNESDTIIYTIVVTNNGGTTAATGVSLTDNLPAGVTYVSDDSSGAYNSGSGIWTIGDLAVNASVTLNITATVNANTSGNSIINTTSRASGDQVDPTNVGDDLTETIIVNKPPVANDNTDVTLNTTTQPSAPLQILTDDLLSDGVTPASPTNTTLDLDPSTAGVQDVLVVAGEGTWNYDDSTGELVFTPETILGGFTSNFTADPTPIVYTLTENQTGLTDTATVTIDYQEVAPIANDDISSSNTVGAVILDPLTGAGADTDSDGVIDPTRVSLVVPSGATTNVVDGNNDVTSVTVPGEGTWNVDEVTGSITFTPLTGFTDDPTPIDYNIADNDGNVSATPATVTVDYVPVAVNDESLGNTVASDVTLNVLGNDTEGDAVVANTFVFGSTANPLPIGAVVSGTPGASDYQLTVAGEGVWSYDGSGSLTFDPEAGFTTDPTVIGYTVSDAEGNATSATVTVTYNEVSPVATDDSVSGIVTGVDAVLSDISVNDTLSDGSPVDTNPSTGNATISIDPNDTDGDGNPLTLDVPGEGVWSYDPTTDDLTFNPDPTFTADPTPIVYTLTETITGESTTAIASAGYVAQAPVATSDTDLNNVPGNLVTVDVTSNDADSDASGSIDPTTVSLIVPVGTATNVNKDANGDVISFVIPGEGTWFVDAISGSITFTPEVGYTQDPTPIAYTVDDNDGNISNQATVTIGYSPLNIIATNDDFTNSPVNGIEGESLVGNILTSDTGDGFDTLDGDAATRNNVIISIVNPATPIVAGALVPVIDVVTGNITVPAGTPADTYTITYSICDKLEPNPPGNCDTAVVTVVVEAAPIVAEDDVIAGGNGLNGNSNVGNLFDDNADGNDTLNGVSTDVSDVAISIIAPATPKLPGAPVPSVDISTGIISIPPGTPAGDYEINYSICEILNPSNCDTATITVTVDPAKIDAINDDFSAIPINGLDGANTASVLLNDTLNGVLVSPADVNLTAGVAPTTTSGGLTMNADGTITVAPNTPAGTYVYLYTICEVLNPTNCDTAEATVVVKEAVIDAIVDDYSLSPVNGLDGEPNVGNALDNDTLNGIPVVLPDVTITIKTPATPIAGAPVPVIDPATGIVSVPVGTPGGTYTIEYTICENLNPNNCDTTTVIVVVDSPEIVAVDNIPVTPVNGFEGKVAVVNVFDNDTLNGILVNPDEVTLKLITADPNNALTLNGDGTVDVAPGTAAGTYELEYQICEVLNPTNCDIAKVIVVVEEAIIVAENDDFSSKPVNSLDGSANVGNVLANNGDGADTLNGSSVDIDAVNLTVVSPATPLTPGATVPVIDPSTGIVSVPSGTPAGTYKIGYSICEELNPTNCDDAIVTVVVGTGPIVANDDIIGNVDGYNGDDNVGNVLTDNGSGSDTLNGVPVLIDEVVISIVTPATPLVSGAPVPTIDPSTGIISVPSGTPGGSYEIEYQICEVLNPVNCTTAIVTVDVKESADLTLLKEVDVDTPNVGDTVNFTITLTNNGLNNATGVNVVDQLPTGYTFVSAVASVGTYSEVSGSWNVGAVTASENETLVITAMVNATGNYTNTAEVTSSDQEDPTSTPGNSNPTEDDYDDATTTPIKITDLVTTKVVSQSVANVGDIVEFTLNVVNNGPSNATGVSLIENLPSGLTYISHTATGGTVNSFTSGIWSIGNLPLGGSATITIRASVNKGEAGNNINNVVTAASGNEVDLTTVGDDLEESIYVTSADLAVTKIVDDATPNVGNTISYVIEVINNGPDTATNVSLVDNLPVGVTFVSSSTTNGTFNNGSGEWSIGDLASGASANLTIEATVNEGTIGKTITNTTSSVVSDQEDPDTTNNIGAVSIVPVGVIDLRLTKTIVNNITTPLVGDKLTFEIRVYNDGPTDATGVQVSELVPSGYKYENYSSTIGTYNPTTGLWNIGKVEVGNTAVLLVDVTVLESGVYENCAEIIAANEDDKDSTPANGVEAEDDYDCASVTPVTELDLSIVKTVVNGNTSPKVGEVITFEIQLTNNGPINGTDVTVIDNLLPLSYTFVNYSSTVGAYNENTGIWNVGKIAANDIEILLIDVIVEAEGTTASYTNCATVNSVHQPDVNATNDTSCITLTPVQTVDLELTKDVSENKPVAGSNVDFTVNLTNNGLSTANGVEVLDLLPSGYTFVSATTTAGSYNELTGLWTVGTVFKDETQTLTVTATVEAFGDWLNIAEVTAVNELDIDSTPNNGDLYEDDMAQRATEPEVLLAIPEGFTPDGDGKNDVFEIKHLEVLYPKFGMEIVNRYGNVVYTYKHDGNPSTSPKWWNGFSTGRWNLSSDSLPAGTYYYTIYFNNDDRKPQTGWLYLRK